MWKSPSHQAISHHPGGMLSSQTSGSGVSHGFPSKGKRSVTDTWLAAGVRPKEEKVSVGTSGS